MTGFPAGDGRNQTVDHVAEDHQALVVAKGHQRNEERGTDATHPVENEKGDVAN